MILAKQTHKQNIKMEFLTIYCFVFLLKMKLLDSFQVNGGHECSLYDFRWLFYQ